MSHPVIIPTEYPEISLRELYTPFDDEAYFESYAYSRPEIAEFDPNAHKQYTNIMEVWLSRAQTAYNHKLRMGIWQDDRVFMGSINLRPDEDGGAELGYWIDSRHTGKGIATVAARAMAAYGVQRWEPVYAYVRQDNGASARVLEKAGFIPRVSGIADHLGFILPQPEPTSV